MTPMKESLSETKPTVEVEIRDLQALCRLTYSLLSEVEESEEQKQALEFLDSFAEKLIERKITIISRNEDGSLKRTVYIGDETIEEMVNNEGG